MSRQSSKESISKLFNRYVWLVDTIYRNGKITFEAINEKWSRSQFNESGGGLPLRTFHNHRQAIEQMFDINIECDRSNHHTYSIENAEDMERSGVRSWLLNTFAINNLINEGYKLRHRILFEHIPSGQQFLTPLIEAMRDGVAVEITYQSYEQDKPHTFQIEPYCVKVFRQRWYVVGNSALGELRIYALDRVHSLQPTDVKFELPVDFDAEVYFAHCFGIIRYGQAERVEVKVLNEDKKNCYFQSLPLHWSQEVVEQTDDYTVFCYFVQPTFDFRQELLSHGAEVEVLSPAWFRAEVAAIVHAQAQIY